MAEAVGFELTVPCGTPVFKTDIKPSVYAGFRA